MTLFRIDYEASTDHGKVWADTLVTADTVEEAKRDVKRDKGKLYKVAPGAIRVTDAREIKR